MPLDVERLVRLRPYLFHLTAAANISRIRRTRVMESAGRLLRAAGRADALRVRRSGSIVVRLDEDAVHIRDQAALQRGNMTLASEMTFEDFVERLNGYVFFWPGTAGGPNTWGMRHFERYREQRPALLRADTASLLRANPGVEPHCCRFNSGSPRWRRGMASPRGAGTFVRASDVEFPVSRIVEITFVEMVTLPSDVSVGIEPTGSWKALF